MEKEKLAALPVCTSSNFSKTSHETSHLLITTLGARWQYFPTRNEHGINDFYPK